MNELIAELARRLKENLTSQERVDLGYAEQMGYDCGMNGPNETNVHFAIFSSPERTKAWEQGKARAEKEKAPR